MSFGRWSLDVNGGRWSGVGCVAVRFGVGGGLGLNATACNCIDQNLSEAATYLRMVVCNQEVHWCTFCWDLSSSCTEDSDGDGNGESAKAGIFVGFGLRGGGGVRRFMGSGPGPHEKAHRGGGLFQLSYVRGRRRWPTSPTASSFRMDMGL